MNFNITESAKYHFVSLIEEQEIPNLNIRIEIIKPDIESYHLGDDIDNNIDIVFCPSGSELKTDQKIELDNFSIYIESNSIKYLADANLDYADDEFGGKLVFDAPNLKLLNNLDSEFAELRNFQDKVIYILNNKINPLLAQHRGFADLVKTEEKLGKIHIKMGGGCSGCQMSGITLKQLILKTFNQYIPEIKEVIEVDTIHITTS